MTLDLTERLSRTPRVRVGNLVLEVIAGPDEGLRSETDSERVSIGTADSNFLMLHDPTVSGFHFELVRSEEGIEVRDLQSTNGTRVSGVQIARGWIPNQSIIEVGNSKLRVSEGSGASVELLEEGQLGEILGVSEPMRRLMARVCRVALSNVPVLIAGESGTGKELAARAIHDQSGRAGAPFVTVDCGALSPTLIASELFGHERGSFTGADRRHTGAFERASGGTLFLDEIGELPQELQPQLLGALERQRFVRVGGQKEIDVDVRVVSATNRDLRAEINAGAFRLDLYYRIAVVTLQLPALRERPDDIPPLIEHFAKLAGHDGSLSDLVSHETVEELKRYRWPGNVRELRNWVEATLAIGEAPELDDRLTAESSAEALYALTYKDARAALLERFEKDYCARLISRASGNVSEAARQARMDRSYLIKLLQKHALK